MKPRHLIGDAMADKPDDPEIFMAVPANQATLMAMIHAMRANTDATDRLAKSVEARDMQITEIHRELSSMGTRLAVIEASGLRTRIENIETLLRQIQEDQLLRRGREGVWNTLLRSPAAWLAAAGAFIAGAWTWIKNGGVQ